MLGRTINPYAGGVFNHYVFGAILSNEAIDACYDALNIWRGIGYKAWLTCGIDA